MKSFLVLILGLILTFSSSNAEESFSSKLFNEIAQTKRTENVIVSPASIRTCLGLAFMGAGGETAKELHDVLQLRGDTKEEVGTHFENFLKHIKESGVDLKTANRIYLAKSFSLAPKFSELVSKYFESTVEKIDFGDSFSAAQNINSWVEAQTNNKIHDLVTQDSVGPATTAVLVNAIYFKAIWKYKFNPEKVIETEFLLSKDETSTAKMMHETMNIPYVDLPRLNAKAIELPYDNTDIHMLIILPNDVEGLSALEDKLKDVNLSTLTLRRSKVNLFLPKFKIEFGVSLNTVLKNLGLRHMFTNGDFSGITSLKEPLDITNVEHKAFIEVDEQGTEAAAATAALLGRNMNSGRNLPVHFIVNHPFFFAIRDRSTVYFAGHVTKL